MNFQLISAIMRGIWAIDETYAQNAIPLIDNIMNGKATVTMDEKLFQPYSVVVGKRTKSSFGDAPKGSVAVIPVQGTLMKNDQMCGPVGMQTISEMIKEADQNPNIKSIVLHIDSPGGTVDGTSDLGDVVKATSKPVLAYVDGLMASAALWVGASANEVMASNDLTEVGSIGVMMSFMDIQPALERQGVKFHTINSNLSGDKNKTYTDLKAGNYDDYKTNVLDPIAEKFIEHVKSMRPGVTDEMLTGKVFFAKDVMGSLVDSIGSFDMAIERASEMADEREGVRGKELGLSTNKKTNKNVNMKQFARINALMGVEAIEHVDDHVSLNEEALEVIETALEAGAKASADLIAATDQLSAVNDQLSAALASAKDNSEAVAALTAEVKELQKVAGASSAKDIVEEETKENETSRMENAMALLGRK